MAGIIIDAPLRNPRRERRSTHLGTYAIDAVGVQTNGTAVQAPPLHVRVASHGSHGTPSSRTVWRHAPFTQASSVHGLPSSQPPVQPSGMRATLRAPGPSGTVPTGLSDAVSTTSSPPAAVKSAEVAYTRVASRLSARPRTIADGMVAARPCPAVSRSTAGPPWLPASTAPVSSPGTPTSRTSCRGSDLKSWTSCAPRSFSGWKGATRTGSPSRAIAARSS